MIQCLVPNRCVCFLKYYYIGKLIINIQSDQKLSTCLITFFTMSDSIALPLSVRLAIALNM